MKQTAGQVAIEYGLRVREVSKATGVTEDGLQKWSKSKPRLLEAVCRGVREMKKETNNQ